MNFEDRLVSRINSWKTVQDTSKSEVTAEVAKIVKKVLESCLKEYLTSK